MARKSSVPTTDGWPNSVLNLPMMQALVVWLSGSHVRSTVKLTGASDELKTARMHLTLVGSTVMVAIAHVGRGPE